VKAVGARGGKSGWRRAVAIHLLFAPECLVVPGLVPAGEPEGNTLADEVRVCATLGSDSERLLCYDRLAATLAPGPDAGPAREAAPVSAQRMFGLRRSAPEQPPAGSAHAVRLDSITARVSALSVSGGSPVLELDNGQVWRVLEGEQWLVRAGDAVVISRAAFGSFRIRAPGGRVARVERLR